MHVEGASHIDDVSIGLNDARHGSKLHNIEFERDLKDVDDDNDDAVLRAQGHEVAMERQFSWAAALGLAFSITNSWIGYLSCFGQNLKYLGPQSCIFGLIAAFAAQWIVTGGLSELASAFPSSGGQYHFCCAMLEGKRLKVVSFMVGWFSVIAWWIVTCSGISLCAVTLTGLIQFWNPGFAGSQWQIYLIYVAVAIITSSPIFLAPSKVSWTVQITLYMSLFGCVLFLITTCAMHQSTQPASFLTRSDLGTSGWSSAVAWMLGIANAMYAFGGTDGAIHISEEMPHPGRRVPQVMSITMILGLVTTLPLMIALNLFITDFQAIIDSPVPSIEIVYQATGNKVATTVLFAWLWIVYMSSLASQWVTSGRIAWAFARDGGTPFPNFFSHIHDKLGFPVRTTIAALIFACLYGLLYLASLTAFNSIVTSAVLFLNISYAVPQGILLWRGRKSLPPRYLDLGRFGCFVNIFAVCWVILLVVLICMPPAVPVQIDSMNWTSVVVFGLTTIMLGFWLTFGKRKFTGPQIDWALLQAARCTTA